MNRCDALRACAGLIGIMTLLLGPVAAAAAHSSAATLRFDTVGGDSWMFDRLITGTVEGHGCDSLTVRSRAGRAAASSAGGRFFARVHLWSGTNRIVAQCWRSGRLMASASQRWRVKLYDVPRAFARAHVEAGTVQLDGGNSAVAAGQPAPIVRYDWEAVPGSPASLIIPEGKVVSIQVPPIDGLYEVRLSVRDAYGRTDSSKVAFRVIHGQLKEEDSETARPDWLDRAVLYGLPLGLLRPVGFEGVRARLPLISRLGATAVWLSPVTEAPAGDFGYAMTDAFRLRAAYGDANQLQALIADAHARHLRVVLDVVTNHLASDSPYYRQASRLGKRSPYYAWFARQPSGEATHYFDWRNLHNLNYDNPEVRAYMTAALLHWVRDYGVDGFRLDAAWALRDRAPELWPQLRQEIKRIDPQALLLAEASPWDSYYAERHFEVVYDWTATLGEWAWSGVFGPAGSRPDLQRLRAALRGPETSTDQMPRVLRFLDNNDTGPRFVTRHGLEQTRAAAALLFMLPGVPVIYAGDEVGASYDPYGAAPIVWPDNPELESLYSRLIAQRRDNPALRSEHLQLLSTDHDESVLAFRREATSEAPQPTVIAINFSAAPIDVQLSELGSIRLRPFDFVVLPESSASGVAINESNLGYWIGRAACGTDVQRTRSW